MVCVATDARSDEPLTSALTEDCDLAVLVSLFTDGFIQFTDKLSFFKLSFFGDSSKFFDDLPRRVAVIGVVLPEVPILC